MIYRRINTNIKHLSVKKQRFLFISPIQSYLSYLKGELVRNTVASTKQTILQLRTKATVDY